MGAPVGNKNAKGNQGGRPSKCTPELLEKVREYTYDLKKFGNIIPSMAGLSFVLSIPRETLQRWRREKATPEQEEFEFLTGMLLCQQECLLINNGLTSKWNSNIVKLLLGKHGYSDKLETDNKHKINSVSINIEYVEPNHNFNELSEHEALPECGDRKLLACSGELQG